jgi:hypothetical protein
MCVHLGTGVLIRREGGGLLLAYSDPNDSHTIETAFDPRFLEAVARRSDTGSRSSARTRTGLLPGRPDGRQVPASLKIASPTTPTSRATPPFDTRPVAVCIAVTETH